MANEYTFGQKLQGIGAALSGQVPQFQQEMQQLSEARIQALYQDAGAAYQMAKTDNYEGIINLANDRLDMLRRIPGANPSDTQEVLRLAQNAKSGDANSAAQLKQVLGSAYEQGVARGYVAKPEPPQRITLSKDQSLYEVGADGKLNLVAQGPQEPAKKPDYKTYEQNGITYYSEGPYAGLSVGKVAELQRSGAIRQFGEPISQMPARPASNVQIPLRPQPPQPDYSGMSQQEQAILMQEQERQRLETERAEAEERRKAAEEERKVQDAEREQREARETDDMMKNELIAALGVIDNQIMSQSDAVWNAVTGPYEGASDSVRWTAGPRRGVSYESGQTLINNLNYLKDLLTMGNLGRIKGTLSDADIGMLARAASGIDRKGSTEDVKSKLAATRDTIIQKLKSKYGLSDEQIQALLPYKEEAAPQPGSFDQMLQQQGLLRTENNMILTPM